jgi:hypothetical protein
MGMHASKPHKILTVFLITAILSGVCGIAQASGDGPAVVVSYYYDNPCGVCKEDEKFTNLFYSLIGSAKDGVSIRLLCYNTFTESNDVTYRKVCDARQISEGQRKLPMLVIGDTVLQGQDNIDEGLKAAFLSEKQRSLAQAAAKDSLASQLVYFYVTPCEDCAAVKEFLGTLNVSYAICYEGHTVQSTVAVESHSVADPQGLELARKYFDAWHVPENEQKVPIVFLRDGYLAGAQQIIGGLKKAIAGGRGIGILPPGGEAQLQTYEWSGIFLTGLVNGFNPCSISLLLFLITLLIARSANVLKLGLTFLLGKFLAYLVLGTLLFNALAMVDGGTVRLFTGVVKAALAVVVLAAAALNVSDFVAAKNERYNGIRMQLPVGLRKLNHRWIKALEKTGGCWLLLMTFGLGIAISVGEFLCTGQIYLATILYLLKRSATFEWQTLGAFLVYIAGMLLPLLVITLAVHRGKAVFHLSELVRRNMPAIKLATAAIFVLFAVLLLIF